jgi:hypothetical protein
MGRKKDNSSVFFNDNYYANDNKKKKRRKNEDNYNQYNNQYNNQYYDNYYNNQYYNNYPNYNNQKAPNNDQFYGQYSYSTNNYDSFKPEKEKKEFTFDKNIFIGIGILVLLVILIVVVIFVLGSGSGKSKKEDEEKPPIKITYDDDTITVGDNNVGFLIVPSNWEQRPSESGLTVVDPEDSNYVASILISNDTIEAVKDRLTSSLSSDIKVNSFEFNGYKAYQVIGYYKDSESWISSIFFNTEDGKLHFAAVMGTDIKDKRFDIVTTYTLKR